MAGAAITIGSVVAPLVLPWIAKLMDKIHGSGTGAVKLADGTNLAQVIMTALQKFLPGVGLPTNPTELTPMLQQVVDALNKLGVLKGHDTVLDPTPVSAAQDPRAFLMDAATMLLTTASQFIAAAKNAK